MSQPLIARGLPVGPLIVDGSFVACAYRSGATVGAGGTIQGLRLAA